MPILMNDDIAPESWLIIRAVIVSLDHDMTARYISGSIPIISLIGID
jgi:hypothetical protein